MNFFALFVYFQPLLNVLFVVGVILAVAMFIIWCIVGIVLWANRAGRDDVLNTWSDPDWFEELSARPGE